MITLLNFTINHLWTIADIWLLNEIGLLYIHNFWNNKIYIILLKWFNLWKLLRNLTLLCIIIFWFSKNRTLLNLLLVDIWLHLLYLTDFIHLLHFKILVILFRIDTIALFKRTNKFSKIISWKNILYTIITILMIAFHNNKQFFLKVSTTCTTDIIILL